MNAIITHADPDRFPILEAESQICSLPADGSDIEAIEKMDAILSQLGDQAAGLAAVQIGYPKRIFLLRRNGENQVFINPVLLSKSKETKRRKEACLSLPGLAVTIPRPKQLTLKYYDLHGESHEEDFRGFWAQCVSHEMDHLNGQLISSHLQAEFETVVPRTKFGMKLDAAAKKRIAKRRQKNKRARKARRISR